MRRVIGFPQFYGFHKIVFMWSEDLKAYNALAAWWCPRSLFWRSGSVVSYQDSISWKRPQMRMCILRWDLGWSSITPSDLKAYNKCSRSLNFMVFTKSFLCNPKISKPILRWDLRGAQDRCFCVLDRHHEPQFTFKKLCRLHLNIMLFCRIFGVFLVT